MKRSIGRVNTNLGGGWEGEEQGRGTQWGFGGVGCM